MNDLDLRAALQRDADLVGEPSPDLLDQLVDRRRHQRRQRAGVLASVAAVVVIAAGIPIGSSFVTRSDGGPATQTSTPTIAPTPTDEGAPETSPAPTQPDSPVSTTPQTDDEVSTPPAGSSAPPAWPPAATATHGGEYWAVFLAVARPGTEEDELQQASADASALGYPAGVGDITCSTGAHEQLGLDPAINYQVVNIYFDTREQAQRFVDLYEPGVVGTALVTAYCLD